MLSNPINTSQKYTNLEQDERKLQVFHLHFEERKSVDEITKLLNVPKNIIDDDIQYWYSRIGNPTNVEELTSKMTRQILLIYLQRDRLVDYLNQEGTLAVKLNIEKFIHTLDNKLVNIYSKMRIKIHSLN